jgi:peptidoglycan hydrolase CwlO-like protein
VQHSKHEQWFQEAGAANQRLQSQVGSLSTQVTKQQQEVHSLSADIKSVFQNIEALLAKKQRVD